MLFPRIVLKSPLSFGEQTQSKHIVHKEEVLVCQRKGLHQELTPKTRHVNILCLVHLGFGKLADFSCLCLFKNPFQSDANIKANGKNVRPRA